MSIYQSLRGQIRALRLYYRSHRLFREALSDYWRAWWFPLAGGGEFRPRRGAVALQLPRQYWTMLPTACRLLLFGAHPKWHGGKVEVTLGKFRFVAAPTDKSLSTLKEIFVDDVYGLRGQDLTGQVVLDVGANIGDSTVAFAALGATVHAFEPLPILQPYLQENVDLNGFGDRVVIHAVGLSNRDETLQVKVNVAGTAGTIAERQNTSRASSNAVDQELHLVHTERYLAERGIHRADVLKIDCEGCEYAMFADDTLLKGLRPRRIILEYHRGGDSLEAFFEAHGYHVERPERTNPVGYLYAAREPAETMSMPSK